MQPTGIKRKYQNYTKMLIQKRFGTMIYESAFSVIGLFDINHITTDKMFYKVKKNKRKKSYTALIIPNKKFIYLVYNRTQKFYRLSAIQSKFVFPLKSKIYLYIYIITSIIYIIIV